MDKQESLPAIQIEDSTELNKIIKDTIKDFLELYKEGRAENRQYQFFFQTIIQIVARKDILEALRDNNIDVDDQIPNIKLIRFLKDAYDNYDSRIKIELYTKVLERVSNVIHEFGKELGMNASEYEIIMHNFEQI